jgi:hypothetical protein
MRLLLLALMIVFSVAPVSNCFRGKKNKDYNLWYRTGHSYLRGEAIYPKDGHLFPFMYPPPCAAMLAVASTPGERPFVVGLVLVNSAAWVACILLAVGLAAGSAPRRPLLYALPTACVLPYIHDTYLLGQPNLLLLAVMLGAFTCLRAGRPALAGVLVAMAAAVKAFPILAVGYLIYRRCWRALAALVLTLASLLLLLPIAFRGTAGASDDLVTWTGGMVLKYDEQAIAQRPERCYSFKNQSLMALANRLLRSIPADGEADQRWKVNVADLRFEAVNAVIAAAGLGLCLFYVLSMPRSARRTPSSDAAEQAMLLLLILDFSPLAFNYYYVWLLFPIAVLLQRALGAPAGSQGRRESSAWLLAALAVLATAAAWPRPAQAYGNLFFANLLLLAGLGRSLRRPDTAANAG